jgi:hypothetical protein
VGEEDRRERRTNSHKGTERKQESVSHRGLKRRGKRTEGKDGLIATKEHRENKEIWQRP